MPIWAPDFAHLAAHCLRHGRTALPVDVAPIGGDAERDDIGAKLPQRSGRDPVGGAIGAVHHDFQAVKADGAIKRTLGKLDVAVDHAVDAFGLADTVGLAKVTAGVAVHLGFDFGFHFVGKLVSVRAEKLDSVVLVRVMRGGNHDAEVCAQGPHEHGDRRRRNRPELHDIHADGSEAGNQRGLDGIAGKPRIFPDYHPVASAAIGEHVARSHANLQRDLRRHWEDIRFAANAVGSEEFSRHDQPQMP